MRTRYVPALGELIVCRERHIQKHIAGNSLVAQCLGLALSLMGPELSPWLGNSDPAGLAASKPEGEDNNNNTVNNYNHSLVKGKVFQNK